MTDIDADGKLKKKNSVPYPVSSSFFVSFFIFLPSKKADNLMYF